jgi:hypothetical protein
VAVGLSIAGGGHSGVNPTPIMMVSKRRTESGVRSGAVAYAIELTPRRPSTSAA